MSTFNRNNKSVFSNFVLGTVQMGTDYGIANQTGKPSQESAIEMIKLAWKAGITEFDTAQVYGDAEQILGSAFRDLGIADEVSVISKFSNAVDHLDEGAMKEAFESSLQTLGISSFKGMMLHNEALLNIWPKGLSEIIKSFRASGKMKLAGVSVYSPEKALNALELDGIDFVQIPGNLLDRRFEKSGVFEAAIANKKQIYIRSIFLQGLLVMDLNLIPEQMNYAVPYVREIGNVSNEFGFTPAELAIGFAKLDFHNCQVLLGADSIQHLKSNIKSWQADYPKEIRNKVKQVFSEVPEKVTNILLWPK